MGKKFKGNCDLDLDSKSICDLDLDPTMANVELIQAIFISYNIFKFQDPRSLILELSCLHTHTHRQTDRHTELSTLYLQSKPQVLKWGIQ